MTEKRETVTIVNAGKHHLRVDGTMLTYCGRPIGPASLRFIAGIAIRDMLCQDCVKATDYDPRVRVHHD
jgi:hypothetical protein